MSQFLQSIKESSFPASQLNVHMLHRLTALLWAAYLLCVTFSAVEAATWHEYRLAGFKAFGDGDYTGAVEQFEIALVVAYEEHAPPDHLAAILENLATAFLAAGRPERAWEAIERWDKILAASADEPWVPEHQKVRDELAPRILEALALRESPRNVEPSANATTVATELGDYAVHLESLKFQEGIQPSWTELKATYPSQLSDKSLVMTEVDLGEQGIFYRILAAPFASSEEAKRVCSELRGLGQYCAVVLLE